MDETPESSDLEPADSGGFLTRLLEAMRAIWEMGNQSKKGRIRGPWVIQVRSARVLTPPEAV